DVAHLTLGTNPTVFFSLTPSYDAGTWLEVSRGLFRSNGNGDYSSGPFTATQAGTYHWRASYSGDPNNNPAGPTACADPAEAVVVDRKSVVEGKSVERGGAGGVRMKEQATTWGEVSQGR